MSRVIKFRAYQPHASLHRQPGMYLVDDLVFYKPTEAHPYSGEVFLTRVLGSSRSSEYIEDINLMQFTGLLDKNGVDIYEGDILSSPSMPDSPVEHQRGSFNAVYADGSHDEWEAPLWRYTVEVIGNIYEHPELLEKAS